MIIKKGINIYKTQIVALINPGLILLFLLHLFPLSAQFTVRLDVFDPYEKGEIFLAGSFNNWNPGDHAFKLNALSATHRYIILKNIPSGRHAFKFTRGNWETVETSSSGKSIANRIIEITKDTVIPAHISGWIDDFYDAHKTSDSARSSIRLEVYDPAGKPDIFLAGGFNNWNPGDHNYRLFTLDSFRKYIVLKNMPLGKYYFKFTRGNWNNVETTAFSEDIEDRVIEIKQDTTVQLRIEGWMDDYINLAGLADSTAILVGLRKSYYYREIHLDSSYKYALHSLELSRRSKDKNAEIQSMISLGAVFKEQGNSVKALELLSQVLPIAELQQDSFQLVLVNQSIGDIFGTIAEYDKAKYYYLKAIKYTSSAEDIRAFWRSGLFLNLARVYYHTGKLDSASYYANLNLELSPASGAFLLLGDIDREGRNQDLAMTHYRQAVDLESKSSISSFSLTEAYDRLAQTFFEAGQSDSAFHYARLSLTIANRVKNPSAIVNANALLSKLFESRHGFDSAFYYQKVAIMTNDSIFTREKEKQIHTLVFNEQLHQQEMAAQNAKLQAKAWIYSLAGGLLVLLLIAGLLSRNIRQRKATNILLKNQKDEIEIQKRNVEETLSELKSTQAQLIQSEKMASLGELTAGIAHEIQNPLNFITNFTEINQELLDEMQEHRKRNSGFRRPEAGEEKSELIETEILNTIRKNQAKILQHGKRADSIVKSMLQHSRSVDPASKGKKEPTDINALAGEYLRLAHHAFQAGLRAKDMTFKAAFVLDLDPDLEKFNVVPQDMGRVLHNLINNAFWAVTEKQNQSGTSEYTDGLEYKPTVTVKTQKINDRMELRVIDNGMGIPQNILDKIFQPFFTTKPTGQGTGLGLSLSYDIIKAHGGDLRVETNEGEGSSFIISLPKS